MAGQHLMQASSDIFLGWDHVEGIDGVQRDFYIRQLRDWKGSVDTEVMVPQAMAVYGRLCGWTLARAHARSGDRIAIAAYLGRATCSTRPLPPLRRSMPTRTSATTTRSSRRPPKVALWSSPACEDPTAATTALYICRPRAGRIGRSVGRPTAVPFPVPQ